MEKREIHSVLTDFLNERLMQVTASGQAEKNDFLKAKIRPVLTKGVLHFQAEEFIGKQAFHKNLTAEEAVDYLEGLMETSFRQLQLEAQDKSGTVLVSKKGKITVKVKKKAAMANVAASASGQDSGSTGGSDAALKAAWANGLSHNRKKRYILEEGIPVPFLVELGVQTKDGAIVHAKYDKFRQINRFLEFIEDVLPKLDKNKETRIIDFGCGKSYLTFAMYYYLKVLKGYPVRITGLDLKTDVIEHCSRLAKKFGYDSLEFLHGDIASYEGTDEVDMVVTLHACDTATDYALEKAVRWNAKVILSVPCCQHEVNKQMESELFAPVFHYGIIKERRAALYTDALRAEVLEAMGYRVQILEFIDMEHTPKNLLIRAVKQGEAAVKAGKEILAKPDATQAEADAAANAIADSMQALMERADIRSLRELTDAANELLKKNSGKYTDDTAKALQDAVAHAEEILGKDGKSDAEINEAYNQIMDAIVGLKMKGNKAALEAMIKKAESILAENSRYVAATIEGLDEELAAAKAVYDNDQAVQSEVNEAVKSLTFKIAEARLLGDVDGDGQITTNDTVEILRAAAEIATLSAEDAASADVNGDGAADTADAVLVLQYASEAVSGF